MKINLEFKLEDLWIGVYWRYDKAYWIYHVWVCLIPCFPIQISWDKKYS